MTVLRELVTKWSFDIDAKPLEELNKGVDNAKGALGDLAKFAIGAGAALVGMAKVTADAGNDIAVTSKKVGLTTDQLQEYRFAAEQAGFSSGELDSAFFNLNKTIGEARQGFGSGRTGVELLARETGQLIDLNGDLDSQFSTIIDALNKVQDSAKRAAIAEQFFGGEGRNLAGLLEKGSAGISKYREEFRQLNGVMGGDTIKASQEFIQLQSQLKTIFVGIRNEIASQLLPVMNGFIKEFREWFKANRELIKQNIVSFIKLLVTVFKSAVGVLQVAGRFVMRLVNIFGGLENILEKVAKIFIFIKGLQLAAAFGQITLGVIKFVGAIKAMGAAALFAQAKLLLIPLAITAIIAAIGLIAEDLMAFNEGRDSVFGRIVAGIQTFVDGLNEKFSGLGDIILGAFSIAMTPIRGIINMFKSLIELVDVFRGKISFMDAAKNIGKNFMNSITGSLGGGSVLDAFGLGGDKNEAQLDTEIEKRNMRIQQEGAKSSGEQAAPSNVSNSVNGQFKIDVTGLPPEAALQAAESGFENVFKTTLRQAQRDLTPAQEF